MAVMATHRVRSSGWMTIVVLAAGLAVTPSSARAGDSDDAEETQPAAPSDDTETKETPAEEEPNEEEPAEEVPEEEPAEEAPEEEPAEPDESAPKEDAEPPVDSEPKKKDEDPPPKKEAPKKEAPAEGSKDKAPSKKAPAKPPKKSTRRAKSKAKSKAEPKEEREAEKKEVIRQVRPSRYIRIRARSVKLKSKSHDRLLDIAKRYHEDTGKKLLITGGDRTPHRQAELMYRMLAKGDDLLKLYTQVRLVLELTKIYESGKEKKRGARNIIRDMGKAITEQVKRGEYVSHHLAYTAADVRSRGLKDDHVLALRRAVNAVPGAKLVDERKSDAPHFHLSL